MTDPSVLEARAIVKEYPGVRALDGVDFDLRPGEIHALLGENGAGKSTLVNVLTGVTQPDSGTILVEGRAVQLPSPRDAALQGINVIHQDLRFAPELDVRTTLSLGDVPVGRSRLARALGVVDRKAMDERATRALAAVHSTLPPHERAGALSVAQGQLLQIARALSAGRQSVLLLDEPTASLSPSERDELFGQLRRLKGSGIGILYISHRLEEIVEIADRATVLRDGRVVGSLARDELSVERVAGLMLGESRAQAHEAGERAEPGEVLLEVRGFTREPAFRDVDLTVRAGEIVGLTGLVGAGRTELARCIFGADPLDRGELLVRGTPVVVRSPRDAIGLGVGYLSEDRKSQGVFFWLDVRQNLITSALRRRALQGRLLRLGQLIRGGMVERIARSMISRLDIRPASPAAQVGTMSGGNQQKVILGRWLTTEVPVLIFDEPTRGVDVGAKADIWARLRELTLQGTGILAISSEVPELLAHANRIVVMKAGRMVGELAPATATEESVMLLAGGTN